MSEARTVKRFRAPDYKGFHAIGRAVGLSARSAKYRSNLAEDPLPVHALDGGRFVCAYADELQAWDSRRVKARRRKKRPE